MPNTLSGYVYLDIGPSGFNDRVKQASEQGLAGVGVYLIGADDHVPVNTFAITDANGFYSFAHLRPGAYALIKGPTPNLLDGKGALGSQGGKMIQNEIYNIGLTSGINGTNNNFGELLPNSPTV
jgi:SdrD B-like domain